MAVVRGMDRDAWGCEGRFGSAERDGPGRSRCCFLDIVLEAVLRVFLTCFVMTDTPFQTSAEVGTGLPRGGNLKASADGTRKSSNSVGLLLVEVYI